MGDSRMTSGTMDDVFYWVKLFTKVLKIYFYSFSQQLKTIFFVHKGTKGTKLLLIVHELIELNEFFFLVQKELKRYKKRRIERIKRIFFWFKTSQNVQKIIFFL